MSGPDPVSRSSRMTTSAQRVLGAKYRLLRPLTSGGMGTLWIAEHLSLHSAVAVKLLSPEIAETAEGEQRFLREACTAASLRSPHVVQILDHGVDEGTPYIVMELLDGESLASRLQREPLLGAVMTERIVRHVARAVGRAHEAGIVHRDLKPSNIFIVENDEDELIKVLDFGIAKTSADWTSALAGRTRTGTFLGTPGYVSPEQAEGASSIDHRTDIWSLGVIAFECLLGRPPFVAESFGSLLLAICSRPLPVPSEHGPVPRGFDEWFARACARAPEQRFQSAREASRELRRLLDRSDGEGSGSGSGSAPGRPRGEGSERARLSALEPPASSVPFESTAVASSAPIPSRSVARRGRWMMLAAALGLATLALVARSCVPAPRGEPAREVLAQQPLAVPVRDVPRVPAARAPVTPAPPVAATVEATPAGAAAPKPAPLLVPRPVPAPERRPRASLPGNVVKPPVQRAPATGGATPPAATPSINLGLVPPEQSR